MAAHMFRGDSMVTQLQGAVDQSVQTLVVDDGSTFPSGNFTIVLGRGTVTEEKVFVANNSANQFTGCLRGFDDTSPFDHAADVTVEHCVTAEWFQRMDDFLNAGVQALTPAGVISAYAGTTPPPTHAMCDGLPHDGTDPTYAALYAVIGTTYGGTDITNFQTPNLKGKVIVMRDATIPRFAALGQSGGELDHPLSENEGARHKHPVAIGNKPVSYTEPNGNTGHTHGIDNHQHNMDHGHTASGTGSAGDANASHEHGFTTAPGGRHGHVVLPGAPLTTALQQVGGALAGTVNEGNTGEAPDHTHTGATDGHNRTHQHGITVGVTVNATPNGTLVTPGGNSAKAAGIGIIATANIGTVDTDYAANAVAHNNVQPYLTLNYIIRL